MTTPLIGELLFLFIDSNRTTMGPWDTSASQGPDIFLLFNFFLSLNLFTDKIAEINIHFLPIHTASCYYDDKQGIIKCTTDYFISMYTPSIDTLLSHPPTPSKSTQNPPKCHPNCQIANLGHTTLQLTLRLNWLCNPKKKCDFNTFNLHFDDLANLNKSDTKKFTNGKME